MQSIYNYTLEELKEILKDKYDLPGYRAVQLFNWLYKRSAKLLEGITVLKKDIRNRLQNEYYLSDLIVEKIECSSDGTKKILFKLSDDNYIESVLIPNENKLTLCISSQVGCALGCSFCRTAEMGFIRNLTTAEIIGQIVEAGRISELQITNIVYMGMGEPLLNLENVIKSVRILLDKQGFELSPKRITISTSGVEPGIYELADKELKTNLTISLNSPFDEQRAKIMPICQKYNIESIMEACLYYINKNYVQRRKLITLAYVLMKGFNDSAADAKRLGELGKSIDAKINVIPYNSSKDKEYIISEKELDSFTAEVYKYYQNVLARRSRGKDISADCGQLSTKKYIRAEENE